MFSETDSYYLKPPGRAKIVTVSKPSQPNIAPRNQSTELPLPGLPSIFLGNLRLHD
jgi:hypothetical protein